MPLRKDCVLYIGSIERTTSSYSYHGHWSFQGSSNTNSQQIPTIEIRSNQKKTAENEKKKEGGGGSCDRSISFQLYSIDKEDDSSADIFHPICMNRVMKLGIENKDSSNAKLKAMLRNKDVRLTSPVLFGYSPIQPLEKERIPNNCILYKRTLFVGTFEIEKEQMKEEFYVSIVAERKKPRGKRKHKKTAETLEFVDENKLKLIGAGENQFGTFIMEGYFIPKTGEIRLNKTYRRKRIRRLTSGPRKRSSVVAELVRTKQEERGGGGGGNDLSPEPVTGKRRSSGRKRRANTWYSNDLGWDEKKNRHTGRKDSLVNTQIGEEDGGTKAKTSEVKTKTVRTTDAISTDNKITTIDPSSLSTSSSKSSNTPDRGPIAKGSAEERVSVVAGSKREHVVESSTTTKTMTNDRSSRKRRFKESSNGSRSSRKRKATYAPLDVRAECDVCGRIDVPSSSEGSNERKLQLVAESARLLQCAVCRVSVHGVCYGVEGSDLAHVPQGTWTCNWCSKAGGGLSDAESMVCVLCSQRGGALKETTDGRWVHLFCALWTPECAFADASRMEPVGCVGKDSKVRGFSSFPFESYRNVKCAICKRRGGGLLRCCAKKCKSWVHPRCAARAGHLMDVDIVSESDATKTEENTSFKYLVQCPTHVLSSKREVNRRKTETSTDGPRVMPSGDIYDGALRNGRPHGHGTCIRVCSGHMYEGAWRKGKFHGYGVLTDASGRAVYEGEFFNGQYHGSGTLTFANGEWYDGEFGSGLFQGRGTYVDSDGGWYSGEWKSGKRHGRGKYVKWPSMYDGGWRDNLREGRGELWTEDGLNYEGQFKENLMEGRGAITYPDGSRYVGLWRGGKKEGRGTITFANGSTYAGHFRDDKFELGGNTGTFTMLKTETTESGEILIPIRLESDFDRIHLKAGFTKEGK